MFIQSAFSVSNQPFIPELTPLWTVAGSPDIYFEPAAPNLAGWRSLSTDGYGVLYNFGSDNKGSLWGSSPYSLMTRNGGASQGSIGYVVDGLVDNEADDTYTDAYDANNSGVTIFLVYGNCIDEDTRDNVVNFAGVNLGYQDAPGGNPGYTFTVGINQGAGSDYTNTTIGYNTSGFTCMAITVYPDGGLTGFTAYKNGTLTSTNTIGVAYSGADETNVGTTLVRFDIGSFIRYPFVMNGTQIAEITNYLETLYVPFT